MALVVLLCCSSSYSLAYDQQYTVGGTGPQGGVVTSVSVASEVTGTATSQVGDNLETITTTKFTESVVENVTTTNQVTQTTITVTEEDKSTGDIITGTNLNRSGINSPADAKVKCVYGAGSGFYRDGLGCGRHTDRWDDLHIKTEGQHEYTTDMDNWMTQQEMNYGFSATATAQGKDSSPSNTQFTITVKLYDPDTGANTQESNTWTLTSSYQTFSTTLDVGTNTYGADSQLIATFLGVDPNWDGSGYDTDIQNFNMTLTYDVLESVVETINQTIVNSVNSALETIENQTTLVYNPIIQPGTDTTTTIAPPTAPTQDSFTVNVAGNNGGGVNLQFNVEVDETAGAATVEMAATNLETGVVTIDEVANISLDFSSDSGGTTEVVNVAEVETQVGGAIESAVAEATTEMQVAEATPQTTESSASTTESTESTTEATTETETESETASSEGESNETETVQESSSDVEEQVADSGETTSSDKPDGDSKSTDKSGSKSKSKTKVAKKMTKEEKIKEQVDKAKQKIARKILMAMADTYNAINEATKIALMASLTDTESFKAYQKKNNEDLANWYSDLQVYKDMPQLIDPAAQLYELASDKIMNEMIDEQYKK